MATGGLYRLPGYPRPAAVRLRLNVRHVGRPFGIELLTAYLALSPSEPYELDVSRRPTPRPTPCPSTITARVHSGRIEQLVCSRQAGHTGDHGAEAGDLGYLVWWE